MTAAQTQTEQRETWADEKYQASSPTWTQSGCKVCVVEQKITFCSSCTTDLSPQESETKT